MTKTNEYFKPDEPVMAKENMNIVVEGKNRLFPRFNKEMPELFY